MVPETHQDLLDLEVAAIATINTDGSPQVTAVWFLADGDHVKVSVNTRRQKVANLRRDPRCTLFLLDPANPYRYLELRGTAELVPDDGYEFADIIAAKYRGDFRRYDAPGDRRVGVSIRPTKVIAYGK